MASETDISTFDSEVYTLDQKINAFVEPVANNFDAVVFYSVPLIEGQNVKLVLVWLSLAAVFFTVYLGFINLRYFVHSIKLLFGKARTTCPDGEINQFQALMASLSGTVGLGNIGGVAVAISLGGPGAVFWMTLMGILGMSSKFAEVMLGVKYRIHPDPANPKKVTGGPMYFLKEGIGRMSAPVASGLFCLFFTLFASAVIFVGHGEMVYPSSFYVFTILKMFALSLFLLVAIRFLLKSIKKEHSAPIVVGGVFAGLFALLSVIGAIGGGNMYQSNQAFEQIITVTGGDESGFKDYGWLFGLGMSVLVGLVIVGGLKSIARVASKLVPVMGGLYLLAGLAVIGLNITSLPSAFLTIFNSAFSLDAGIGAFVGGLLIGVQRAAFSNEAGLGSASIVQSTTNTDGPVGTGMVAMLGPFIDTIIICNITGLVIVLSGLYVGSDGIQGVELTSMAFESALPNFGYILTAIVLLFAYSTMISWYYCGAVCFRYLFGENDKIELIFKVFFCVCIVIGASAELGNLIKFADAAMLSMAIPNILGLYLFAPEIKRDVKAYIQKLKE